MTFSAKVERWRAVARQQAAAMASRYGVALDESDLLALISHESGGDPTAVSKTGYRGLGQVGKAALADYNVSSAGIEVPATWDDMSDADKGEKQVRVVAWLVANSRRVVMGWGMPDAVQRVGLWADARYSWGGGNLRGAIADYKEHNGRAPTFDELADAYPSAGLPNVRPWHHARKVAAAAAADREVDHPIPFVIPWEPAELLVLLAAVLLALGALLALQARKGEVFA